eukprot:TRINITY_DN18795_c0_g1_i1.p1 TRINITY_DN18795_c0_g1~~TRINITY_DN18795_c0_g1_i1.p1  ORF type:complete len:201 (+),score=66.50 TRINITY_DN18795_c0_g1_i1:11-613(+)
MSAGVRHTGGGGASGVVRCVDGGDVDALRAQPVQYQRLVMLFDHALKVHPLSFEEFLSCFPELKDTHGEPFWYRAYANFFYVLRRNIKQECLTVLPDKYNLVGKWKELEALVASQPVLKDGARCPLPNVHAVPAMNSVVLEETKKLAEELDKLLSEAEDKTSALRKAVQDEQERAAALDSSTNAMVGNVEAVAQKVSDAL